MKPIDTKFMFVVARIIAAFVALYATARHPYSYYVLTRWVVFLTCCWGVFNLRARLCSSFAPMYIAIGGLMNPIAPFVFRRGTWHNIDIAVALVLLASLALDRTKKTENPPVQS